MGVFPSVARVGRCLTSPCDTLLSEHTHVTVEWVPIC